MIAEPSSDAWRRDLGEQPDDGVQAVADEHRGLRGRRGRCPTRSAALRPSTTTRSPRAEWPASKKRPADSWAWTAANRPGDAAFIGSCVAPAASGSLIGTERTSWPRTSTSASVPAATTPLSRRSRASASHGSTIAPLPPARTDGLTHDVGRRQRVEAPDDLVAGRLREAERGHERADADDRAEHGQRDARRAREQAGERLGDEVAPHMRGRHRSAAAVAAAAPRRGPLTRSSVRRPSTIRTWRSACPATCVLVRDDDERQAAAAELVEQGEHRRGVRPSRGCPSARRTAAALWSAISARAMATRCCSPPDSRVRQEASRDAPCRRARARPCARSARPSRGAPR